MKKVVSSILTYVVLITVIGCSKDNNDIPTQDYINYTVKGKVAVTLLIDPETGLSVGFDENSVEWDNSGPISDYVKAVNEIAPSNNTVDKDEEIKNACDSIYETHKKMMNSLGFWGTVEVVKVTTISDNTVWSKTYP
jgi:hypothetical protein